MGTKTVSQGPCHQERSCDRPNDYHTGFHDSAAWEPTELAVQLEYVYVAEQKLFGCTRKVGHEDCSAGSDAVPNEH